MTDAILSAARAVLHGLDSPLSGDVRPLMRPQIEALRQALLAAEAIPAAWAHAPITEVTDA